jgi:cytosolic carboxypeptidase protein 2/3
MEPNTKISLPSYKKKKNIIVCARVHPGESNSSFMMHGFIQYLLGNTFQARELRKRCVFRIIPMVNPDGVIIGNYRTNMAGNDLNRKYHAPDEKLHPTVSAIKKLVSSLTYPDGNVGSEVSDEDRVFAFIDMHGHSRKKNVFCYGPYYPLHSEKYLKMRILPKLISEQTSKFRFFSCKFRIERSKEKAARIVLWREFSIMNCFTFEASFFGGQTENRKIEEFTPTSLEKMGEHLCNAMYEYLLITEEEDRQKKLKETKKNKKRKKVSAVPSNDPVSTGSQLNDEAGGLGDKKKKKGLTKVGGMQSKKETPRFEIS